MKWVLLVVSVACPCWWSSPQRGRKGERVRAPRGPLRVQGDSRAGLLSGLVVVSVGQVSVSLSAINSCDVGQAERHVVRSELARSVVSSVWLASRSIGAPQVACVADSRTECPFSPCVCGRGMGTQHHARRPSRALGSSRLSVQRGSRASVQAIGVTAWSEVR